jgi:hypothetical protein
MKSTGLSADQREEELNIVHMSKQPGLLLLFSLLYLTCGISNAANEMFTCKMNNGDELHLIFTTNTNKADMVLSDYHVSGNLKVEEHHYYFIFPKTNKRYETHITVNRYSGKLSWEHGSPPFGSLSTDNIHLSGTCNKSEAKKLL